MGFVASRNKAIELIKNAFVKVDGIIISKPSFLVSSNNIIEIIKKDIFVSRAGEKLDFYVKKYQLDFSNMNVLDIGSSKGGFTQVLLKYNAKSVTCVDVGKNQLDSTLLKNPRVKVFESCDIREFKEKFNIDVTFDFIVCDVSFISLKYILDSIFSLGNGESLLLFKPQFEVGINAKRNKKGVVQDFSAIADSLNDMIKLIKQYGLDIVRIESTALKGKEGNEEIFVHIKK